MKIYPSNKFEINIHNKKEFVGRLKKLIDREFTGLIDARGFNIQKKFNHLNTFRPMIKGIYTDNGNKIKLSIELNNKAIIGLIIGYIFCVIAIFQSGSLVFLIPAVLWSLMWYFMGWIFYSIDIKKTKTGLDKIIKIASS